jgi:TonB family protein
MDVLIARDGSVLEVKIVRSHDPGLDANAIRALRTWRFEPATKEGEPVAMHARISNSFRLL